MNPQPSLRRTVLVLATLLLALQAPLAADLIVLRNGQELRGRIHSKGDQVRIELELGGTVAVDRGDILRTVVEGPASQTAEASQISADLMARLELREKVHGLIESLADSKESVRASAGRDLARIGRPALPILRRALAAGSPAQRAGVLQALAEIGDPASLPDILGILRNPKDQPLHLAAVKALADIDGAGQQEVLTELLVNSKDLAIRSACLDALVDLRSPFAAPFVVEALQQPELRQAALAAIPRWGDPVLLPYVLPLLDRDVAAVRDLAAGWVSQLINPAHAALLTRLLDVYKDDKKLPKLLFEGVTRLHRDFPVLGDIELLAAPQAAIRNAAFDALHKVNKDIAGRDIASWRAERDRAAQPRLLLVPIGTVRPATVDEIADEIRRSLSQKDVRFPVEVDHKAIPLPAAAASPRDVRRLLAYLDRRQLEDTRTARIIGVTNLEVTVPGIPVALAPTRPGGAILLSLAHLGKEADQALQQARRLALHALARSFGVPPSPDPTCPSSPIYEPRDLAAKAARYSQAAQADFAARWDVARDLAGLQYANAAQKLARLGNREKSPETLATAACMEERALRPADAITNWKAWQALQKDPALSAIVQRRIELLDRAEKWLAEKNPAPPPRRPPRGN